MIELLLNQRPLEGTTLSRNIVSSISKFGPKSGRRPSLDRHYFLLLLFSNLVNLIVVVLRHLVDLVEEFELLVL